MYDNNVMEVVDNISNDTNKIDTKWVFVEQDNKNKKSILVALECQQVAGEDFVETYSPTLQEDSLRLIVATALKYDWELKQLDQKAIYMNANLEKNN